jgi:hypothetical protein
MRSPIKTFLAGVAVAAIAIQFFPPVRNLSAARAPGPDDITVLHPASPEVKAILAKSCYDCHSDNTVYPWYANVQPVGWWLDRHVTEGKRHLDFSQFGRYSAKRARHKLQGIVKHTKRHTMPLASYTTIHRDAKLTDAEIKLLGDWATDAAEHIPAPAATAGSQTRSPDSRPSPTPARAGTPS